MNKDSGEERGDGREGFSRESQEVELFSGYTTTEGSSGDVGLRR